MRFFNSLFDVSDTPTKQAKIDKKKNQKIEILLKKFIITISFFIFLFSVFAFMLLKSSRYWERSQTTQFTC